MLELISIHIPKTAGRTMLNILNSVYGEEQVLSIDRIPFKANPQQAIIDFKKKITPNIKVIHGHIWAEEIKSIIQENPQARKITFMREPINRVISNYCFFKKRISLALNDPELQLRKDETLLAYAFKEDTRNVMTRFIEGLKIEDFFFVGVFENLNADLNNLASLLNWGTIQIPKINENTEFKEKLPPLSEEEIKLIENLNARDMELYSKVLALRNIRLS